MNNYAAKDKDRRGVAPHPTRVVTTLDPHLAK